MFSKLVATGSYLPEQKLTNQMLEKMVETSDKWIVERTGIKERRVANEHETSSFMAYKAAQMALKNANLKAQDIDMIIVATTTPDNFFPSCACQIQAMLDIKNIPAFDLSAACAGFSYVLAVADQFIKTKSAKNILLVGVDRLSQKVDKNDRSTVILFGDGAGACVLSASETPGVLANTIEADGNYGDLLTMPVANKSLNINGCITMKGNEVFKVAVTKLAQIVSKTLAKANLKKEELDWLVPHQANLRIIKATAKKLNLDMKKVIVNLDKTGNTSAASVPIALDEAYKTKKIKQGDKVLLEAFGGGFAWGASVFIS